MKNTNYSGIKIALAVSTYRCILAEVSKEELIEQGLLDPFTEDAYSLAYDIAKHYSDTEEDFNDIMRYLAKESRHEEF